MGIYSDILEANRERGYDGYVNPCMIMGSLESNNRRFNDYRKELNRHKAAELDAAQKEKIRRDFLQRSAELESLKSDYLVAEKAVLQIINHGKIRSSFMQDILNVLQLQLRNAYRAICELRSEIDQEFRFEQVPEFQPDSEDAIRENILSELITTTLYHMTTGLFTETGTFRKVVSDCAEIIRSMENEDYEISDKSVFSYYLTKTMGLKETQYKCCNCGKPLLNNMAYCLNCYERNA